MGALKDLPDEGVASHQRCREAGGFHDLGREVLAKSCLHLVEASAGGLGLGRDQEQVDVALRPEGGAQE